MKCGQVKELLSAYLDKQLAMDEHQYIAAHLQSCAQCRVLLEDFRRFDLLLSELPRISPDQSLHDRIFSSSAYQELTGTFGASRPLHEQTPAFESMRLSGRPHLVALPGGRHPSAGTIATSRTYEATRPMVARAIPLAPGHGNQGMLHAMRLLIAAIMLFTLGIGSFIGWNLLHKQGQSTQIPGGITPPAGLGQAPLPAGTRFVFLRDGALWSSPSDGSAGTVRITPTSTSIASNWIVRPALPGHAAGNMLAYIDLQQGYVHILRSDGQSDTTLPQPLLKHGVDPSTLWDTDTGTSILNSLAWSQDGSMLAFVADPQGTGQTSLYIYSLDSHQISPVTLPIKGKITHPVWSPDSVRLAFEITSDGKVGILDYNTQNHGVLTIVADVATQANPTDSVLALDWSPANTVSALTWSVGTPGHVHSIRWQRVGVENNPEEASILAQGDYMQAVYNRASHMNTGSWLIITSRAGQPGDLLIVSLTAGTSTFTNGKHLDSAQWSPDGKFIAYLDAVSSGTGTLHVIDIATTLDTLVASGVAGDPAPTWSPDSQRLAYCASTHILVSAIQQMNIAQPLKLTGPASALSWSVNDPRQLVIATQDGQQGMYLIDTQHDTVLQLDKGSVHNPIRWTQIP